MSAAEDLNTCIIIVIYSFFVNACACNFPLPTHRKRGLRARTLASPRSSCTLATHVHHIDASAILFPLMDGFRVQFEWCGKGEAQWLDVTAPTIRGRR